MKPFTDSTPLLPGISILNDGSLNITASESSSMDDFNLLVGNHRVHHVKLNERLIENTNWVEFEGTHDMKRILNGLGNIEKYGLSDTGGQPLEGMNLRLFDPATRLWSIYWADSIAGKLEAPLVGSFHQGVGHFFAIDQYRDQKIIIQFRYDLSVADKLNWCQAFSADKGENWEWNWYMFYYTCDNL